MMRTSSPFLLAGAVAAAMALLAGPRSADVSFQRHTLDPGANESCAFADVNKDGKLDIVAGENWFEAPKWTRHHFRDLYFENNYIDGFSDLPVDVNGDGYPDIVTASWFSRTITWWRNPGRTGGAWQRGVVEEGFNTEFAFLVDLNNDGKAEEVLPQFGGQQAITAWYEVRDGKWVRHQAAAQSFGHGIGAGDVNGDGRNDILTPKGWLEAPADPRTGNWTLHPDWESKEHLGFLYVRDVNGDGRPDIVSSHAHDYGLFWMERLASGAWSAKQMIDDTWSQAHATAWADLNGDGKPEFISGKRFLAHDHDPGAKDPLGIYWYEPTPHPKGKGTSWIRHVIDYGGRAGAGMQIPAADLDGDGDVDFAVAGKSGLFLYENKTR